MPRNDEFLDALRRANPIDSVMGNYLQIKKRGRNYLCSCPFHSEKTPSCTVFPETQTFYCFGCGAGGDVITFIQKIENLDFVEAVKLLAQRSGLEMPDYSSNADSQKRSQLRTRIYEMNRLSANFFYSNLVGGEDKSGLRYFAERGINPQTIKKFGLGYAPDRWDNLVKFLNSKGYSDDEIISAWLGSRSQKTGKIYDIFRHRVIFPIVDLRKNIIGFGGRVLDDSKPKYLNSGDTPIFDKGNNLFALNFAKNSKEKRIILCEGYMDVIAVNQAGFENAVATLGTAMTPGQANIIGKYADEAVIAYDSDNAGQNATRKAINLLNNAGVRTKILHMEGAKDPDEFIKKFGRERFKILINKSADSINFTLDNCENGLDLSTESGRAELIERTSAVLAKIKIKAEREIYISRTAKKCDIPYDVLKVHIEEIIKRENKKQDTEEWRETVTNRTRPVMSGQDKETKISNAEEWIITYLMKNPYDYAEVRSIITPENFINSFNKKVYSAILGILENNNSFSVSMLTGEFSEEEKAKITGIHARNDDIDIDMQVIKDCAEVLKDSSGNDDNLDDIAKKFIRKSKMK